MNTPTWLLSQTVRNSKVEVIVERLIVFIEVKHLSLVVLRDLIKYILNNSMKITADKELNVTCLDFSINGLGGIRLESRQAGNVNSFTVFNLCFVQFIYLFYPETTNRRLEEIDEIFCKRFFSFQKKYDMLGWSFSFTLYIAPVNAPWQSFLKLYSFSQWFPMAFLVATKTED